LVNIEKTDIGDVEECQASYGLNDAGERLFDAMIITSLPIALLVTILGTV
jgi:hypothetical protein